MKQKKKLTSRDLAQQRTRETLLGAAARLVAEQGYGAASIGDIAVAAGFTKGAFYSNFDSREAMLLELAFQVHDGQRTAMRELEAQGPPPDLAHALDWLAEIAARHAHSPTAALLIGEMQLQARRNAEFAGRLRKGFEEQLDRLEQWIAEACRSSGRGPALPPRELARTVVALSQGLALQPSDRAAVKGILRRAFGQLFGEA